MTTYTKTAPGNWFKHIPVILALVGVVASTTWTISQFPDRAETRGMIERESPYVEDRSRIMQVVDKYDTVVDTLHLLRSDVAVLTSQIRSLEAKLDQALRAQRSE